MEGKITQEKRSKCETHIQSQKRSVLCTNVMNERNEQTWTYSNEIPKKENVYALLPSTENRSGRANWTRSLRFLRNYSLAPTVSLVWMQSWRNSSTPTREKCVLRQRQPTVGWEKKALLGSRDKAVFERKLKNKLSILRNSTLHQLREIFLF